MNKLCHCGSGEAFTTLLRDVKAYDAKLDDAENNGHNAKAPTGDDYNELYELVIWHGMKAGLIEEWPS